MDTTLNFLEHLLAGMDFGRWLSRGVTYVDAGTKAELRRALDVEPAPGEAPEPIRLTRPDDVPGRGERGPPELRALGKRTQSPSNFVAARLHCIQRDLRAALGREEAVLPRLAR